MFTYTADKTLGKLRTLRIVIVGIVHLRSLGFAANPLLVQPTVDAKSRNQTHVFFHLENKCAEELPDDGEEVGDGHEDGKNIKSESRPTDDLFLFAFLVVGVVVVVVVHLDQVNTFKS